MYRPEGKSKAYLLVVLGVASIIAWAFFKFYRPVLLDESCSEVALNSSNLYASKKDFDPAYSYDNLKERCLEETKLSSK
jgi:hypothetical protein